MKCRNTTILGTDPFTPREIVHYMCQESLINYLDTAVNSGTETVGTERRKQGLLGDENAEQTLLTATVRKELIPRADLEAFIHSGDQASYYEAARVEGTSYQRKLPKTIETHAKLLDDKLADIAVCDPAILAETSDEWETGKIYLNLENQTQPSV